MENVEQDPIGIAPPKPKRGRLIAIIAVLLLLGGGVGAYLALGGRHATGDKAAEAAPEK